MPVPTLTRPPSALDKPVQYVRGVGPQRARLLGQLGIATVGDLVHYFPFRYEEQGRPQQIAMLRLGEAATVLAEVESVQWRGGYRQSLLNARVRDSSGVMRVTWFNQYLANAMTRGWVKRWKASGWRWICARTGIIARQPRSGRGTDKSSLPWPRPRTHKRLA